MIIPDSVFSIPDHGSRFEKIPDTDPHLRIQVFVTQKIDTKLSKIWSGMLIPDLVFFNPGSGSAAMLKVNQIYSKIHKKKVNHNLTKSP
jgi:hypothetical protein